MIPTYNECGNIEPVLTALLRVLDGRSYEIIVVDDDSPNRTWECVAALPPACRLSRPAMRPPAVGGRDSQFSGLRNAPLGYPGHPSGFTPG